MPITKDKSKEYERLHSEDPNIKQFLTDSDKHYYFNVDRSILELNICIALEVIENKNNRLSRPFLSSNEEVLARTLLSNECFTDLIHVKSEEVILETFY